MRCGQQARQLMCTGLGALLFAASGCGGSSDATRSTPSVPSVQQTSEPTSGDATVPSLTPQAVEAVEGSVTLVDETGAAVAGMQAVGVDGDVAVPAAFRPASHPVDVTVPDGVVTSPVTLSMPGIAPPANAVVLLLHRNSSGAWESVPAVFVDGFYVAEVMSFSWYWPGWADTAADWVATTTADAVDWVTGRTEPPLPCSLESPYGWAFAPGGPSDGAFHVCLVQNPSGDGAERVEVKIKSNRAFAMWVVLPAGDADFVWLEAGTPADTVFSSLTGDTGRVLLGPGRTLTVGFRQPPAVSVVHRFFAYQDTWTQLYSLMVRHLGEVNASMGVALAALSCFDSRPEGSAVVSLERAWKCFGLGADLREEQTEILFEQAVTSGRMALSQSDAAAFQAAVFNRDRLSALKASAKKLTTTVALAELAADSVIAAIDAGGALADGAGTFTLSLTAPPPVAMVDDGIDVALAQLLLVVAGHGPLDTDGVFGPASQAAARSFQRAQGLPESGRVDQIVFDQLVAVTSEDVFLNVCDGSGQRPSSWEMECNSLGFFDEVTWSSWSALGAVGTGKFWAPCPGYECADGSSMGAGQVTVELSNPQPLECGDAPSPILEFQRYTLTGDFWSTPNVVEREGPFC